MDVNDIPSELLDKVRCKFDNDPTVIRLRIEQQQMMSRGHYPEALNIGKRIEILFAEVMQAIIAEAEKEVEQIPLSHIKMAKTDEERVCMLGLVMFMACDIIETAVMDVNDVLHRYGKDITYEMFDDMRELSKMAKSKLKFLQKNSSYMEDLAWADKCDNLYEMMQNKAASLMRKRNESKNWGENMKRCDKKK